MMRHERERRGTVLLIVILTGLVCAIASYGMLQAGMSQSRHVRFWQNRTDARYLAEAALVIAREILWTNPNWNGGTVNIDSDGNGTLDFPVLVTVANSANRKTLRATVDTGL